MTQPDAYANTERVHLVSSFMASLLAGAHAPLEPGDASGMNLMDITTCRWAPDALAATAPSLAAKLPPIVPSWTTVGTLARTGVSVMAFHPRASSPGLGTTRPAWWGWVWYVKGAWAYRSAPVTPSSG